MKTTAFSATCPFEIGDKIRVAVTGVQRTITDIACVHYVKSGKIDFLYELDNSGNFVALVKLDTNTAQNTVFVL